MHIIFSFPALENDTSFSCSSEEGKEISKTKGKASKKSKSQSKKSPKEAPSQTANFDLNLSQVEVVDASSVATNDAVNTSEGDSMLETSDRKVYNGT